MDDIFNVNVNVLDVDNDLIGEIENKIINKLSLNENEINYLLSYVCFKVREILSLARNIDVCDNDFANQCDKAQSMICYYFEKLVVFNIPVNIHEVLPGVTGHSFNVVCIDGGYYLLDPTYNQFFDLKKCNDELVKNKIPGYHVSNYSTDEKMIIIDFLKNGFMKIDSNNIKLYGDSFSKTKSNLLEGGYSGSSYFKWFLMNEADLSLTEEDLKEKGLLIEPVNFKKNVKKV